MYVTRRYCLTSLVLWKILPKLATCWGLPWWRASSTTGSDRYLATGPVFAWEYFAPNYFNIKWNYFTSLWKCSIDPYMSGHFGEEELEQLLAAGKCQEAEADDGQLVEGCFQCGGRLHLRRGGDCQHHREQRRVPCHQGLRRRTQHLMIQW